MSDSGIPPNARYTQKLIRCGKAKCKTCAAGGRHGPYWYAHWWDGHKICAQYVGKQRPGVDKNLDKDESHRCEDKNLDKNALLDKNLDKTKELLHYALTLRANKGGAIKVVIREALQLLAG